MDIALKQRLVGASVLVALGVIFIPMMLDGPGSGNTDRESVRIPQQPDHHFESRLLPVEPLQSKIDADSPPVQDLPEIVPETTELIQAELPAVTNPVGTGKPAAREPVAPARKPVDQPQTTTSQSWVLQLGSFGNAANAARLVENLKQQSLAGYQEKVAVGGTSMYRVRIGSWSSKEQAADAGSQVSAKFPELDISVRQIDASGGVAPQVNKPGTGWMVQVGSFSRQQNALDLRDKLRGGGFAAAIETTASGSYKVLVGPALSRSAAESTRDRLKRDFAINGIVLSHP